MDFFSFISLQVKLKLYNCLELNAKNAGIPSSLLPYRLHLFGHLQRYWRSYRLHTVTGMAKSLQTPLIFKVSFVYSRHRSNVALILPCCHQSRVLAIKWDVHARS